MKLLKALLFTAALPVAAAAELDTTSEHYYMFIYFLNETKGASIALSNDGLTWTPYNNEEPVIVPEIAVGQTPLMRDPNTYYDEKTGVFHLTWTTAWDQNNVGYATSSDLKTWSKQVKVFVGERIEGCLVCWAPEFFYDDQKDSIMLMWSTSRGSGNAGKEAFRSMTKNFRHYTAPKVYFAPTYVTTANEIKPYTVIDETLLKMADSVYYLFFKDERENGAYNVQTWNIHYVIGPTPQGPWKIGPQDDVSLPVTTIGHEGPTAIVIGDELMVYADPYKKLIFTDRLVKAKVSELSSDISAYQGTKFTAGQVLKKDDGSDFRYHHGSISEIPRAKVLQLMYGIPDQTVYPETWTPIEAESEIYVEEIKDEIDPTDPTKVYPYGKRNCGCGTGVGLAFFPPVAFKAISLRRRKKRKTARNG